MKIGIKKQWGKWTGELGLFRMIAAGAAMQLALLSSAYVSPYMCTFGSRRKGGCTMVVHQKCFAASQGMLLGLMEQEGPGCSGRLYACTCWDECREQCVL